MSAPIPCTWDGESFRPLPRFAKQGDATFVVGEVYQLVEHQERSTASHRHFFASVNEAWLNLPEHLCERFQTAQALRKYALIKTGFADHRQIVASSHAEALRLAAFIRPLDEYALVLVDGRTVNQWTAQSQSVQDMGKERFQDSKTKVLDWLDDLLGVTRGETSKNAERAA